LPTRHDSDTPAANRYHGVSRGSYLDPGEEIDPQAAENMAHFYVERLDQFVGQFGVGEAGRQRTFLTGQIARARIELDAAEESLRRFQESNKAIVLQEQTRGAIDAAARLKAEIMAGQVQL